MSNSSIPILPGLPSPDPPPPDPTAERCHLLGPTALVVQAIMGFMVLSSLVVKRHLEKRKRPWRVWMLDVGKQLVGQATLHALNILISMTAATSSDKNPCSLYFLNILIDTTVGVGIFYVGLLCYTKLFVAKFGPEGFTSGQYGRPPQWRYWVRQLQPYLAAVVTMKLIVLLTLTLPGLSGGLIRWGQSILGFLSLDVQVVFVLAIFPVIMNVFQFCVMDQVIKAGKGAEAKERGEADEYDDEEMDGYEPVPTREAETDYPSPRRRASSLRDGVGGSRASSRASSVVSLQAHAAAAEEQRLLEAGRADNVWAALSRRNTTGSGDEAAAPSRSPRTSFRGRDEELFADEPNAVPLAPLSPRISRT